MRASPLALALSLCAACSATGGSNTFTTSSSGATGTGGAGSGAGGDGFGGFPVGTGGGGGSGGGTQVGRVYAHSATTLYELEPFTKAVTTLGDFKGCSSVWDIAVDKDGVMFATTQASLWRIDIASATCTHIADGPYPNSLSFVPVGTVDPNAEALVGYVGDVYIRIDTQSGAVTPIGSLGGGAAGYASSGDVVSVIGGGTYLTVKGGACQDCIVEVNPVTGAMKKMIGPVGHSSVFGLAFWAGSAYGFADAGDLFQIDLATGKSTSIPMPNPPIGLSFWGAGSTTSAPLEPPH